MEINNERALDYCVKYMFTLNVQNMKTVRGYVTILLKIVNGLYNFI